MKKLTTKLLSLLLALALVFTPVAGPAVNVFAAIDNSTTIADGFYKPNAFTWSGGSGRVELSCNKVSIKDSLATADIVLTSKKYIRAEVDGVEYTPVIDEEAGTSTFTVPVALNTDMIFSGTTVAMSQESTIDYTINVSLDPENLQVIYDDGFYTSTVKTNTAFFGYKYPKADYDVKVTVTVKDGVIKSVDYTDDINQMDYSSNHNYLTWAMEGHNVTDYSYEYIKKNYETYGLNPEEYPPCGTGLREQIVNKNGTEDVDTVTSATISSKAVIEAVNQSIEKAKLGQKDDPEPVLPQEDTSEDIIPQDGIYVIAAKCDSATIHDNTALIFVKDGAVKAQIPIEQRESSYPYIYPDKEAAALAAGEGGWFHPIDYDYNYKYMGSLYRNIPIKSLDKTLPFVMYAKSSGNWFNRLVRFYSEGMKQIPENVYEASDVKVTFGDENENPEVTCERIYANLEGIAADITVTGTEYSTATIEGETYSGTLNEISNTTALHIPINLNADTTITLGNENNPELKTLMLRAVLDPEELVISEDLADYTAVDAALAAVPDDLSIYTDVTAQAVEAAVAAVERGLSYTRQAEVDAMAEAINAAVADLVEKSAEPEKIDLAITNNTGMFKAVTAYLTTEDSQEYLVMALSGTGYKELYKGIYEQAIENGDGSADNGNNSWIHGYTNDAGQLEFKIPMNADETYVPCVAISNSYYMKYLNGQNALERSFYPRQFEINREAKTLVTGDYDETADFAVTSMVTDFKVKATASTEVVGGPNSNNYCVKPVLEMEDATYDKVTYPTVVGSQLSTASADLTDGKFEISLLNAPNKMAFQDKTPIEMTFHVAEDAPYVEAGTNVVRMVTIDKMAKTIVIEGDPLIEETAPEKTELAITNNTGMFNVVTAYLTEEAGQEYLVAALNGTGYKELFKGTYEQAVANGDGSADNGNNSWIHGYTNDAGKLEFKIPLNEDESYVPCVAVSNSYYTKYLNGQNALARAFYPRQFEINREAKTLVTGDYEFSKELAVTNNVSMFKVDAARLDTVGGPNSNNYAADLVLTMGSTSYGKAYVGTAGEAHKADSPAVLGEDNTFRLSVKWVETFGQPETLKNLLDEPFIVSFHSTKKDAWYERKLTVSEAEGTIVFDSVPQADYKAVDAAIAKVPSDLSIYTDETAQAVEDALAGVVQILGAEQQAEVDAMAEAIEAAVAALKEKPADYTAVDAALAKVPSDLTIYTEETAAAVTAAVGAVVRDLGITKQAEVDAMAEAIEEAVGALVKIEDANAAKAADELIQKAKEAYDTAAEKQKAVDDAQAAYNALTDVQKALLPDAEADLQAAQEAATEMMNTEKAANDAAEVAKTLIDAVKTAAEDENTTAAEVAQAIEAAKEALKTAQEAYGKLNDKQKAQEGQINVDDIASEAEGVFTEAEATVTVKQTAEAVEAVKKAAETAKDPKATSKDVNDAIKAAEDALNVLTDEQKQQVEEQIKEQLGESVDQIINDAKTAAAAKEEAEKQAEDGNKDNGGNNGSKQNPAAPEKAVSIGTTFAANQSTFKVTKAGEVTLQKSTNKKAKKAAIPAVVAYQGKTFKVTAIADKAFAGCKKLKQVEIGANITTIGKQAFKGDKKLKKIIFKGMLVKKVGKKAFSGISKKATFKAPKKVLKKYRKLMKKAGAPKSAKYKK